jgi:hypothetical protein
MIICNGATWDLVDVSNAIAGQTATNISVTPYGNIAATNVQTAIQELDDEKIAKTGGVVTGELLIGTAGTFGFEGSTANAYETYLSAVDPTADRAIVFPDQSGNVIVSGNASIVNADINASAGIAYSKLATLTSGNILVGNGSNVATSVAMSGDVTITNAGVAAIASNVIVDGNISASAEIAVSKLADGAARQLLQTDAAGTGVEWTNNVDVPGTLDVTSTATFDATAVFAAGSASNPSLTIAGDLDTGIYSPGANQVAVATNGTGRLFVDASGRVGIGTTSPSSALEINAAAATSPFIAKINTAEAARIDTSGRLLVGTSTARSNFFGTTLSAVTQTEGTGGAAGRGSLSVINNDVSNNPPYVLLGRSGAATLGSNAAVVSGSRLGTLTFQGADGTNFLEAATVAGEVDGTPGTNDMPGRLVFSTTADGASSPTERMRISQNGVVTVKNGAVAEIGTLTDGATITPDFAANCNFTVTLGGARTIANPSNLVAGQSGSLFLVQDATGGRSASWGSYWDFAGGTAPTLSTAANVVDRVDYIVRSSTSIHTVFTANYS